MCTHTHHDVCVCVCIMFVCVTVPNGTITSLSFSLIQLMEAN